MMCMMIAGPRQQRNDIDDLRKLWEDRVDVWDGNLQQTFRLCAMVFCTINDFSTYGNLSGYSVKRQHACLISEKEMSSSN